MRGYEGHRGYLGRYASDESRGVKEADRDNNQRQGANQALRDKLDTPWRAKACSVGPLEHLGSARHNGSRMLTAADYQTYESIVDLALHHAGLPCGFDADEEQGGGLV